MRSYIFAALVAALLTLPAFGQRRTCSGGSCYAQAPATTKVVAAPPALAWFPAQDGTHLLYRGETLVGQWLPNDSKYRTAVNGRLADRGEKPPIDPPSAPLETPTGVAWERIEQAIESVTRHGRPATKEEIYEAFALPADSLHDDSKHLRLTIYSKDGTARKKLRDEVKSSPAFEQWKPDLLLWDAPPDHWSLDGLLFTDGEEGALLETHEGRVLHHQKNLQAGPLLAALRRADPKRDPKSDPDLSAASPVFIDPATMKKYGGLALVCAAGAGLYFYRRGSPR